MGSHEYFLLRPAFAIKISIKIPWDGRISRPTKRRGIFPGLNVMAKLCKADCTTPQIYGNLTAVPLLWSRVVKTCNDRPTPCKLQCAGLKGNSTSSAILKTRSRNNVYVTNNHRSVQTSGMVDLIKWQSLSGIILSFHPRSTRAASVYQYQFWCIPPDIRIGWQQRLVSLIPSFSILSFEVILYIVSGQDRTLLFQISMVRRLHAQHRRSLLCITIWYYKATQIVLDMFS